MSSEADENGTTKQKAILQSVSSARFTNVQMRIVSEEPNAKVFCFMLRSEVTKMFERRERHIKDLVETGKIAESRMQIDEALRNYYWALVLAQSNPKPVDIAFDNRIGAATSMLNLKIRSMLAMIHAQVTELDGKNAFLSFTYDDKKVSTLQFKYNDGQSIVGPVVARDGSGEANLVSIPGDGKLNISYEIRFREEVDPTDMDIAGAFNSGTLPFIDSSVAVPFRKKDGKSKKRATGKQAETDLPNMIAAQPSIEKTPITTQEANSTEDLYKTVLDVEKAIASKNPKSAYSHFTPEGYQLFATLMEKGGDVSISGRPDYKFILADGYIIGKSTQIKRRFRNGKVFMDKLVYRFDPHSRKIESVAFALTQRAENDIMNAAASWPEVSRWAILNFMEDYQTAFALKRLDYISSIFSDDALIITGTVLKKTPHPEKMFDSNKAIHFGGPKDIAYSKFTKQEYINRLKKIFDCREYVHLLFEDNVTKLIDLPAIDGINTGAAFGIEIKQRYESTGYSDDGYLTMVFDTRGKQPVIHVRLWQPDKNGMISLQEFISRFKK